jgi:hypothetical protein
LIAVVCVGIGAVAPERRLWPLVALSALPVVALTLVPAGGGRAFQRCAVQFGLPTLGSVELLANVALLFPLVYFLALATRRPLLALAGGVALSAAIEAVQALIPAINRSCDTNDWAMNSLGVLAAAALAWATLAVRRL